MEASQSVQTKMPVTAEIHNKTVCAHSYAKYGVSKCIWEVIDVYYSF